MGKGTRSVAEESADRRLGAQRAVSNDNGDFRGSCGRCTVPLPERAGEAVINGQQLRLPTSEPGKKKSPSAAAAEGERTESPRCRRGQRGAAAAWA